MNTPRIDYRPGLGMVRDQGLRPTCLSHATSTAHEHLRQDPEPLCAETLHHDLTGGHSKARGAHIRKVVKVLPSAGQVLMKDSTPWHDHWLPPSGAPRHHCHAVPISATIADIKQSLEAGKLVVLGLEVTPSMYTPQAPWVFSADQSYTALHAVTVVGLGTQGGEEILLFRNSWGDHWADKGHAWLTSAFIAKHVREALILEPVT